LRFEPRRAVRNRARRTVANSNLGNGNLRPETFGETRLELPLRVAEPPAETGPWEATYGNVVLSCGVGNHVGLRGLPGGAEGIRTYDLRGAEDPRARAPALPFSAFTASCGYPIRKRRKSRSANSGCRYRRSATPLPHSRTVSMCASSTGRRAALH
jgi:hypothetical protein